MRPRQLPPVHAALPKHASTYTCAASRIPRHTPYKHDELVDGSSVRSVRPLHSRRRCYSNQQCARHYTTSGIIAAQTVSNTSSQDVISAIEPVPQARDGQHEERDAVILLSRGLSQSLVDGSSFKADLVNALFQNLTGSLRVLLAVVDRIPGVVGPRSAGGEDQVLHASDVGLEGLAYITDSESPLLSQQDAATPSTNAVKMPSARSRDPIGEQPGSILFEFVAKAEDRSSPTDLEVALANTVFTTGTRRVLNRSTWYRAGASESFSQTAAEELEHDTVSLLVGAMSSLRVLEPSPGKAVLQLPLVELTPARKIAACMGNIVRGIEGAGQGASSELETAVTQYFVNRGEDPTTAAVWALITPSNLGPTPSPPDMSGDRGALLTGQAVATAIWNGASLRKVLSGGGGWGQKAGLLSLDPEAVHSSQLESVSSNVSEVSRIEDIFSERRLVDDIAKPGDSIQFFMAPNPSTLSFPNHDHDAQPDTAPVIDFGVLPIAYDEVSQHTTRAVQAPRVNIIKGHFGALSEVGLGLTRRLAGRTLRTKIDAPAARLTYRYGDRRDFSTPPHPVRDNGSSLGQVRHYHASSLKLGAQHVEGKTVSDVHKARYELPARGQALPNQLKRLEDQNVRHRRGSQGPRRQPSNVERQMARPAPSKKKTPEIAMPSRDEAATSKDRSKRTAGSRKIVAPAVGKHRNRTSKGNAKTQAMHRNPSEGEGQPAAQVKEFKVRYYRKKIRQPFNLVKTVAREAPSSQVKDGTSDVHSPYNAASREVALKIHAGARRKRQERSRLVRNTQPRARIRLQPLGPMKVRRHESARVIARKEPDRSGTFAERAQRFRASLSGIRSEAQCRTRKVAAEAKPMPQPERTSPRSQSHTKEVGAAKKQVGRTRGRETQRAKRARTARLLRTSFKTPGARSVASKVPDFPAPRPKPRRLPRRIGIDSGGPRGRQHAIEVMHRKADETQRKVKELKLLYTAREKALDGSAVKVHLNTTALDEVDEIIGELEDFDPERYR